ncbi:helix-turn-helix domain-containing protein [Geodermatophilus marinus]|nr:helix-turn-helix domain-containing protein [Geodermatophilus sp. LHW52908]
MLREARARAGITQADLAARAGTTQSVVSAYESGRREPTVPVLLRLIAATGHAVDARLVPGEPGHPAPLAGVLGRRVRRHRREIAAIATRYGVGRVRVFGSVARGTERPGSDIDLVVDVPDGTGLFTLGRLRRDLEELLDAPVDVVPAQGLKPDVAARIAAELVDL